MSPVRIAVLQHADHEGPGAIRALAEGRGATVAVYRLHAGDPPPFPDGLAAIVTMGGPMGVNDIQDHPYLVAERGLIARAVAGGTAVLGVCLGAQQIAEALGGRVFRGPESELGPGFAERADSSEGDPLFGAAELHIACFHWHGDTFELPPGAERLAGGEIYPNQAFRCGSAWGLQFHVEVDEALMDDWRPHLPAEALPSAEELEAIGAAGRVIIGGFLDAAGVAA